MSDMKKILVLLTLPVLTLSLWGTATESSAGPNPYQSLLVLPTATNYLA